MERQAEFFMRDFTQAKNIEAADRNAGMLLGKHGFDYAAAFYLLIDRPKDAIKVLVKNCQDYYLAYLIARLYCGDDSEFTNNFLRTTYCSLLFFSNTK